MRAISVDLAVVVAGVSVAAVAALRSSWSP